jgi:hypothetical protein
MAGDQIALPLLGLPLDLAGGAEQVIIQRVVGEGGIGKFDLVNS